MACLRPPIPPASTNLVLTDWNQQPIPFGGTAMYVCKRGMFFEADPEQLEVLFECQDGSATFSKRGYFNAPPDVIKWPRCLEGTKTHLI